MTLAPKNLSACEAAPMPSKKLMCRMGWFGVRDHGAAVGCVASRVAESLPSPLRVVPIAIGGRACPSSPLCL